MKKLNSIALLMAITFCGISCTDKDNATRILEEQGYTEIEITGYSPFSCSEDDIISTGFKAKSPSGKWVKGTVCSGLLKGSITMNNLKPYTRKSWEAGKDGYRNGQRILHEDIHVIPEKFRSHYPIIIALNSGEREEYTKNGAYLLNGGHKDHDLYEAPELKPVVVTYDAVFSDGLRSAVFTTLSDCKKICAHAIAYYKVTVDPNETDPEKMVKTEPVNE